MSKIHHLHHAALLAHGILILATVGAIGLTPWPQLAAGIIVVIPLLLLGWGLLWRDRGAYPWLAVVLVLYVGASSVEVVASSGSAYAATTSLLAAMTELGLLLALIRQPQTSAPRE